MSKTMTAGDRLNRLTDLSKQAGPALYERVKLVTELLDDIQWVGSVYNGDQSEAADRLQIAYFSDVGGLIGVITLADIFRMFPDEATWSEHHYDLQRMRSLWRESTHPSAEPAKRTDWKKMAQERGEQICEQEKKLDAATSRIAEMTYSVKRKADEVDYLRERVRELEKENAELRGELKAMRAGQTVAA